MAFSLSDAAPLICDPPIDTMRRQPGPVLLAILPEENECARTPRILIVGGGIGGLAAALALERRRAEVIVCEQSPKLSEIGAGIGLAPNAIKALRALGLEDKINAIAYASEFAVIRSWKDGRPISRAYQGDYRREIRRAEPHGAPRRPA